MFDERKEFYCKLIHRITLLIGAVTIILPLIFWNKIPDQLPMHYNGAGIIDRWSDKSSLILLCFVIVMMMGLMSLVIYFIKTNMKSKYSQEYEKSTMSVVYPMLVLMNFTIQLMLSYIMFCCVACRPLGIWFLPVFCVGIFLPIVYMVYKAAKIQGPGTEKKAFYKAIEKEQIGQVYRSAVDLWLMLILVGSEGMMLWLSIEPIVKKGDIDWLIIGTTILVTVLLLPLVDVKYVLYKEHMTVAMGYYGTIRIKYKDIKEMKKTMNPLSSAAMSLKRIQIDYVEDGAHHMILISPKNREEFIKKIEQMRG